MPKAKMHDLVILLPGITGSVLRKHGKDLWAVSGQALWQVIKSRAKEFQTLRLPRHDPRGEPPETEITATALIDDFHGVFGLWGIDGYDTTVKVILDAFDVRVGKPDDANDRANLIPFPYDWRLSNRFSAQRLKELVDRRLPAFRKATVNPAAKVILLAHSMGGLVSRYYLEVLGGWHDCRTLITFGTPYRGSLDSLNYLANGFKKAFVDLSDVMRSLPAVYELMPRYRALQVGGEWKRPGEVAGLPGIDADYAKAALDFYLEIDAHVEENRNDPEYAHSPYPIFPVVGVRQTTLNSAILESGKLVASALCPDWLDQELEGGDGTVPRVSASPYDREKDLREIFFAERHASLQRNEYVLTDLIARLQQLQAPKKQAALGGHALIATPIGLEVDDLYLPDEPVDLYVAAENIEPFGAPRARIEKRSGEPLTREAAFVKSGDKWTANLGVLAAGQYRVRVDTTKGGSGAPTPVHEIFEVAE